MKKGKITTIETACIKGMVADNVPVEEMAGQLNRSLSTIGKKVDRITAEAVKEQLFINKTASGNTAVSIMTEAASVRGDTAKSSDSYTGRQPRRTGIHKIKDNG